MGLAGCIGGFQVPSWILVADGEFFQPFGGIHVCRWSYTGTGISQVGFCNLCLILSKEKSCHFYDSDHFCFLIMRECVVMYKSVDAAANGNWSKRSVVVKATSTNHNARLALTSTTRGVFWIDQVSAMPTDTFKVSNNQPQTLNPKSFPSSLIDLRDWIGAGTWVSKGACRNDLGFETWLPSISWYVMT